MRKRTEVAEANDDMKSEEANVLSETRNAFRIMLESTKRGSLTPKMPERIKRKRRIDLKLSSGKKSFDLKKWCTNEK